MEKETYISNDGEHWGHREEMEARNDDLLRDQYAEEQQADTTDTNFPSPPARL